MLLTEFSINALKPQNKQYKVTDGNGLYLLVTTNGSKLWRFDYKYQHRRKTLAIGLYPDTTLAIARQKRDKARQLLSAMPPLDHADFLSHASINAPREIEHTFGSVALEWLSIHSKKIVPSQKHKTLRRMELYLFPWLAKKDIGLSTL